MNQMDFGEDKSIGNDVTMRGGASSQGRVDQYELLHELGGVAPADT